jgi:hypothetical protein
MAKKEIYFYQQLIDFQNKFKKTENIYDQPYDRGGPREEFVRYFIKKYLPKQYGVTTGKVIGIDGNLTRQCDIIIYDVLHSTIIYKEESNIEFQIIPAESTIAVIEVKSILTYEKYEEISKNIKSFKELKGVKQDSFGSFFAYSPTKIETKEDLNIYEGAIQKKIIKNEDYKRIKIGCVLPNADHPIIFPDESSKSCFIYMKRKITSDSTVPKEVIKQINAYGQFCYSFDKTVLNTYMFILIEYLNKWNYKKYSVAKYFYDIESLKY